MTEERVNETAEDARQGKTGVGVRYVLVTGLILVVVGFAAVALLH